MADEGGPFLRCNEAHYTSFSISCSLSINLQNGVLSDSPQCGSLYVCAKQLLSQMQTAIAVARQSLLQNNKMPALILYIKLHLEEEHPVFQAQCLET